MTVKSTGVETVETLIALRYKVPFFRNATYERDREREKGHHSFRLQCRRILGGQNLVLVRCVVVAAIFHFMTVEDWGE